MNRILLLSMTFAWVAGAAGQTGESAFHEGAHFYVDGELQPAIDAVVAGLATDPDNPKLLALHELLKEEQEEQEQSGSDDSEGERSGEQNQSEDQQQQPEGSDQENSEGENQDQQESEEDTGEPRQEDASPEDQEGNREERDSVPAGADSEELSRAQAARILQALQNEEEQLLREVQKIKGRPRRVEKDW